MTKKRKLRLRITIALLTEEYPWIKEVKGFHCYDDSCDMVIKQ